MSKFTKLAKEIVGITKSNQSKGPKPYDVLGTVSRVDTAEGKAYVKIGEGAEETPVDLMINCVPGDTVQVRVGGGRAWLTGNGTRPPTDDRPAIRYTNKHVAETKEEVEGYTDKKTNEVKKYAYDKFIEASEYNQYMDFVEGEDGGLKLYAESKEGTPSDTYTMMRNNGLHVYKSGLETSYFGSNDILSGRYSDSSSTSLSECALFKVHIADDWWEYNLSSQENFDANRVATFTIPNTVVKLEDFFEAYNYQGESVVSYATLERVNSTTVTVTVSSEYSGPTLTFARIFYTVSNYMYMSFGTYPLNPSDHLFSIGNGEDAENPSNAFTVDFNGEVNCGKLVATALTNSVFKVEKYEITLSTSNLPGADGTSTDNSHLEKTESISKSGYYPLLIAGFHANKVRTTVRSCYLTSVTSGSANINIHIRNDSYGSASASITADVYVLWVKTTA